MNSLRMLPTGEYLRRSEELSSVNRPTIARQGITERLGVVNLDPILDGRSLRPEPTILRRDDRQALLYPTSINLVFGDSGAGKGWLSLFAAAEQIRAGRHVVLIDLEDVPESIVSRLYLLGLRPDEIRERFHYLRPVDPLDPTDVELLAEKLNATRNVALVIVDSFGEAFGLAGINENNDNEVGPWIRQILRPLADAGAAVLAVDHVTKAGESPLHPSGSKRKRAAVGGAAYRLDAVKPLTAATGGRLRLTCAKDRHGWYARGEHVADLVATVGPGGTRFELYAPSRRTDGENPLAEKILDVLSDRGELSLAQIEASVEGRSAEIRRTTELLALDGDLVESAGKRGARIFTVPPEEPVRPRPDELGEDDWDEVRDEVVHEPSDEVGRGLTLI